MQQTSEPPSLPRTARVALWCLSGWFFLTLTMSVMAGANFGILRPDRLPRADEVFAPIEVGEPRTLALRFVASELNRAYFTLYGSAQVIVGVAAVLFLALSGRAGRVHFALVGLALLSAFYFRFGLVPDVVELGRQIDFDRDPDKVARFDVLHRVAVGIEGAKMLVLLGSASVLTLRRR